MDKIKKMWRNLSLRKSIILYISAFVILAILLSAGTATLCNNATKTIESKYPPTGEKYYLTNENGERLGDGNYIGVAPLIIKEMPSTTPSSEVFLRAIVPVGVSILIYADTVSAFSTPVTKSCKFGSP